MSQQIKKPILLFFISVILTLVIIELLLRGFGFKPGIHSSSKWFHEVDTLVTYQGFYSDTDGIFKVQPQAAKSISYQIEHSINKYDPYRQNNEVAEIYCLSKDILNLKQGKTDCELYYQYLHILSKNGVGLTDLDSAILTFLNHPINDDGFKSIPFKNYKSAKKKILLIGDSFTWGHSATDSMSDFADILLAHGYAVYNTGVSGADPTQYLLVAQKYIPLLKPDVVIVNFFMGNDIFYFHRPATPDVPLFYSTNAGNLVGCPNGIPLFSAAEAYHFTSYQFKIPQTSTFNKICSYTSTTTVFWKALLKLNIITNKCGEYGGYWKKADSLLYAVPYSNRQIDSIRTISEQYACNFKLVLIPDILYKQYSDPAKIPHLFDNLKYYVSPVNREGYNKNEGHFNIEGHKKYTDFLEALIQNRWQ